MDRDSIERLCRPDAFNHSTADLVLRETHISWIILCGPFAYKLKKPVNFEFLDFSTLEKRKHFCEEELRLNRRFSPELYLAVVAVTGTLQQPEMNGSGTPIDYAVKMQRFDETRLLDAVAARGELDTTLIRSIGREMARLHGVLPRCSPDPAGSEPGTPAALQSAMWQNFRQIRNYPLQDAELQQLWKVETWTRARLEALLPMLHQRVRDGWVIDGHGDSHLGNMVIIDGRLRLFDCIEFNAAFRIIDSVGEIALLDMDLKARGHPAESHRLLGDYLEYRGDFHGLALLDLYRSYYALVRAKVQLLRYPPDHPDLADTGAYTEMRRYLGLACSYSQPRQRFLAITHGLSGSGKSTVAGRLVEASGAIRIRSDVERKRLAGLAPEQRSRPRDVRAMYSKAMSAQTFDRLADLATVILNAGFAVIVDGSFLHRQVRDGFHQLADQLKVSFVIADCVASPEELRHRLHLRTQGEPDASEADIAVMEMQRERREPLTDDERWVAVSVDSGSGASQLWKTLRRQLELR